MRARSHECLLVHSFLATNVAGPTDEEIVEVVTNVALNFFTNFVNRLAQTEIDFPVVRHA